MTRASDGAWKFYFDGHGPAAVNGDGHFSTCKIAKKLDVPILENVGKQEQPPL